MIHYTNLIANEPTYELVDIYADEGLSAVSTEKRPDFLRMMADARNGKIDKIIAKSLSRFSRNQLDSISAVRELKSLGISVVFEKKDTLTAKFQQNFKICKNTPRYSTIKGYINGYFDAWKLAGVYLVFKDNGRG